MIKYKIKKRNSIVIVYDIYERNWLGWKYLIYMDTYERAVEYIKVLTSKPVYFDENGDIIP